MNSIAQCRLDFRTGLESAENLHGSDGRPGKVGGDVGGDDGQAENLDVKRLTGRACRFEIGAAVGQGRAAVSRRTV